MTDPQRGSLTQQQVDQLLQPIRENRIFEAQGQSHVAAWDITAHLSRIFGFGGWDKEILSLDLVFEHGEEKSKRVGWYVTYRCTMRLTVYDPQGRVVKVAEDAATGSSNNMPSRGDAHDFAIKNSISYALKRCAKDLGDQYGLSLYRKGQHEAVVVRTLVGGQGGDIEADVPAPTGLGHDEQEPEQIPDETPVAETNDAPPSPRPAVDRAVMVPLDEAKPEVLKACQGDKGAARAAWDKAFGTTEGPVGRKALDIVRADCLIDTLNTDESKAFMEFLDQNQIPNDLPTELSPQHLAEVLGWLEQ